MLKNLYSKIGDIKNPLMLYVISRVIIGIIGIFISFVSLKDLTKIIKSLLKNKSYIGNESYLAAVVITSIFCILIVIWGSKNIISGFIDIARHYVPEPLEFDNYNEVENALVGKQIPSYETAFRYVVKKDKAFLKKCLIFLGIIIIFFIGKILLPDHFFWNFRLKPQNISFPLLFTTILAAVSVLRWASIHFHSRIEDREIEVSETLRSIKALVNPKTFVSEIEKALLPIQQDGKPNIIFSTDFTAAKNSGKIHQKVFIETYPKSIPYTPLPISYLYLLFAIILFSIGFIFLAQLPPDNISVLTVPKIAINYVWTIVKGAVLVSSGIGLLASFSRFSRNYQFESVIIYIEIDGVYEEADIKAKESKENSHSYRNTCILCDCHFKIYATTILTEMNTLKGKRNIVKMNAKKESENAKKMVIVVIESFAFAEKMKEDNLPLEKEEE